MIIYIQLELCRLRSFSHLSWYLSNLNPIFQDSHIRHLLATYLARFSALAGDGGITCGTVLNWLEIDNRGNRLIVTDDSTDINTPAVAAAYATKRYAKQASDEISFEVGLQSFN